MCCFGWWAVEDFTTIETLYLKKYYHDSVPSPMRPNELWTCPRDGAARAQAPGCQSSSCGSVRRGRGGDRCSQPQPVGRSKDVGDLGSFVRLPWLAHDEAPRPYITIPQYQFNKKKQHTPFYQWKRTERKVSSKKILSRSPLDDF